MMLWLLLCYASHELTKLIAFYFNSKILYNGVKQTLTEIRTQYWISRGRSFIENLLNICVVCKKINSGPYHNSTEADLPKYRISDNHPFTGVYLALLYCFQIIRALDYLALLYCFSIFSNDDMKKVYLSLCTSAATRTIVSDVVHNARAD